MANKIYEYKLHMKPGGVGTPDFILDGGYFFNGSTYVAVIPEESQRTYYVPDSLVELSLQDLKNRIIYTQNNNRFERIVDNTDYHVLNNEELELYVENWYNQMINK